MKCLIDLALRMECSKLFDSLTQKGNKRILEAYCSVRKFL